MKKNTLLVCSLAFWQWFAKAQTPQDTILPKKISKTSIDLVYNHYIQDGNNSAVTGGIGTEKLRVYSTQGTLKHTGERKSWSLNYGTDLITSPSTDKIDFVESSASLRDARYYGTYTRMYALPTQKTSLLGGAGFSFESDYLSFSGKLGIEKESTDKMRTFEAQVQMFMDDLRWGRRAGKWSSLRLIYPSELRYQEWYSDYQRRSFNFRVGMTQVLNKRNVLGIFPEVVYQSGLLATPFHRIYFTDSTRAVEQLPYERWKGALALRLNSFVGGKTILKNILNGYYDTFGVLAFSIENETVVKISPVMSVLAHARFYTQQGSRYFAPYMAHRKEEQYYTSDYDLSTIQTYQVGTGFKYTPFKNMSRKLVFNSVTFRYNFMYRSNVMTMHTLSLALQSDYFHLGKKKK